MRWPSEMLKAARHHVNKEYNNQVFLDAVDYSLAHLGVYSFLFSIIFFIARIYVLKERHTRRNMNLLYLFHTEAKQIYGEMSIDKINFEYVLELKAIPF